MTRSSLPPALALLALGLTACMHTKPTVVGNDHAPERIISASELPAEGCKRKRLPSTGRMAWVCPEAP